MCKLFEKGSVRFHPYGGYWIVRKKGSKESAVVKAFREWLLSELVEMNKRFQGMKLRGSG
jgi:hypothetical protein